MKLFFALWPNGDATIVGANDGRQLAIKLDTEGDPSDTLLILLNASAQLSIERGRGKRMEFGNPSEGAFEPKLFAFKTTEDVPLEAVDHNDVSFDSYLKRVDADFTRDWLKKFDRKKTVPWILDLVVNP